MHQPNPHLHQQDSINKNSTRSQSQHKPSTKENTTNNPFSLATQCTFSHYGPFSQKSKRMIYATFIGKFLRDITNQLPPIPPNHYPHANPHQPLHQQRYRQHSHPSYHPQYDRYHSLNHQQNRKRTHLLWISPTPISTKKTLSRNQYKISKPNYLPRKNTSTNNPFSKENITHYYATWNGITNLLISSKFHVFSILEV